MAVKSIYSTNQDGFIQEFGGFKTAYPTGNYILSGSSSSTASVEERAFFFFQNEVPINATITSASFNFYVNSASANNLGVFQIWVCNNACAGTTLSTANWGLVTQRLVAYPSNFSAGQFSFPLEVTDINRTGFTNIAIICYVSDAPGEQISIDSVENPSGRGAFLSIEYTVPDVGQYLLHQNSGIPEAPNPIRGFFSIKGK